MPTGAARLVPIMNLRSMKKPPSRMREGLDRINKALNGKSNGVRLCVDLSATPFYIQGYGNKGKVIA